MKSRLTFVLTLLVALSAIAPAQLTAEQKAAADRVMRKIRKLEMYNQILPVLFTKDQIKAFLPALERYRSEVTKLELDENKILQGFERELDQNLERSANKGEIPESKTLNMAVIYFKAFAMKRKALVDETVAELTRLMKEKLNDGQVRSAANAMNPRLFLPDVDPEKMTEDQKLDLWVRMILIEAATYDILVELNKKA